MTRYTYTRLSRTWRWRAWWAGYADARKHQPYPDNPSPLPPAARALTEHIDRAIADADRNFRTQLRGLTPLLAAHPTPPTPTPTDGPDARAAATATDTADQIITLWHHARATIHELNALRQELLDRYTTANLRHHPQRDELTARHWHPTPNPLPDWTATPPPHTLTHLHTHTTP